MMRNILERETEQQPTYFDQLRKNYPIRREFPCYEVIVSDKRNSLVDTLSGLGFKVETSKTLG